MQQNYVSWPSSTSVVYLEVLVYYLVPWTLMSSSARTFSWGFTLWAIRYHAYHKSMHLPGLSPVADLAWGQLPPLPKQNCTVHHCTVHYFCPPPVHISWLRSCLSHFGLSLVITSVCTSNKSFYNVCDNLVLSPIVITPMNVVVVCPYETLLDIPKVYTSLFPSIRYNT